jgi:hypothetical protein
MYLREYSGCFFIRETSAGFPPTRIRTAVKPQGKVSRNYEGWEEYKIGKLFLLTLAGC